MTSTVLILHVRPRICRFRHFSSIAGAQPRFPTATTASSPSTPISHTTRRFAGSVSLQTLFPECKADAPKPANGRTTLTVDSKQDIFASPLWKRAFNIKALHSRDTASPPIRRETKGESELGTIVADDLPNEHSCTDQSEAHDDADTYGEAFDLSPDAGDPFYCDDIEMRRAKALSKYAWVSCSHLECRYAQIPIVYLFRSLAKPSSRSLFSKPKAVYIFALRGSMMWKMPPTTSVMPWRKVAKPTPDGHH